MKRKLLVLPLLIALMIACVLPTKATENESNGVAVTNGVGNPDGQVRLQISVPKGMYADYMALVINEDSEYLVLDDESDWLVDGQLTDVDIEKGTAVWGNEEPKIEGDIFEIVFNVVNGEEAVGQEFEISCHLVAEWNDEPVKEAFVTATVAIKNQSRLYGTVKSAGEGATTVEILSNDEIINTFTLEDENTYEVMLEAGDYKVRVSKAGHCTRTYDVTMKGEDMEQNASILLCGDVTGDDQLDKEDVTNLANYIVKNSSCIDEEDAYMLDVADVKDDGRYNVNDVTALERLLSKTN